MPDRCGQCVDACVLSLNQSGAFGGAPTPAPARKPKTARSCRWPEKLLGESVVSLDSSFGPTAHIGSGC
jgi:hypothetical protein